MGVATLGYKDSSGPVDKSVPVCACVCEREREKERETGQIIVN